MTTAEPQMASAIPAMMRAFSRSPKNHAADSKVSTGLSENSTAALPAGIRCTPYMKLAV
jgi:hypothetical protein